MKQTDYGVNQEKLAELLSGIGSPVERAKIEIHETWKAMRRAERAIIYHSGELEAELSNDNVLDAQVKARREMIEHARCAHRGLEAEYGEMHDKVVFGTWKVE